MNHSIVKVQRGKGGGKIKAKRLPKGWLLQTVQAQQLRISVLDEQIKDLQGQIDALTPKSMPEGTALAPTGLPAEVLGVKIGGTA